VLATRDIAPGEELLQDYRAIARVPWFEELLAKADLQSARELGESLESKRIMDAAQKARSYAPRG
jgi:hypothetical protein